MTKLQILALLSVFLLVIPFSFADVGPAPPPPDVIVNFQDNGVPITSITSLIYHCMGSTDSSNNIVKQRLVTLNCSTGSCTNDIWFYKLNSCYPFPSGYFSYAYAGKNISTDTFNNTLKSGKYEITVDAPSGKITKYET
ncbi:hypothetical protein HZC07_02135, partial [Candidatus Micrarchaeota archaeon]|nr:hypothetical protein [Candidatus Micrarchaeota archaeon]